MLFIWAQVILTPKQIYLHSVTVSLLNIQPAKAVCFFLSISCFQFLNHALGEVVGGPGPVHRWLCSQQFVTRAQPHVFLKLDWFIPWEWDIDRETMLPVGSLCCSPPQPQPGQTMVCMCPARTRRPQDTTWNLPMWVQHLGASRHYYTSLPGSDSHLVTLTSTFRDQVLLDGPPQLNSRGRES